MIPLNFYLQIAGPISLVFNPPVPLQSCQDSNDGIQIIVYVLDQLANPVNISSASLLILRFQRPDGTAFKKTGHFITNGFDGGIYYSVTDTDFTENGFWQVQAFFTLAGDQKTTRIGEFLVGPNILAP